MPAAISIDDIKYRLHNIFGDKYEFDFSNFKNTHSKIGVKCPIHGWCDQILKNLFDQHGCRKCSYTTSADKQRSKFDDVLKKFKTVHGDKYDYSKFEYLKNRLDSTIICRTHGEFKQSAFTHLKGHGCPSCSKNKRMTSDEFINKSKSNHSKEYIYDFVDYKNMQTPVKIVCPRHGEFWQFPQVHINGGGCPTCNQSKGERMIEIFLKNNNIKYINQKKFDDCKNISQLAFDFYLPDYNCCVEFNGIQHYYPVDIFGGKENLEITIKRDKIKEKYCKDNNINLIIIKQDKKHIDINNVKSQITDILNFIYNNK